MNKGWGIIALAVAALYWLQAVLIPLALTFLFTYLLNPVVNILQRRRLNRMTCGTIMLAVTNGPAVYHTARRTFPSQPVRIRAPQCPGGDRR